MYKAVSDIRVSCCQSSCFSAEKVHTFMSFSSARCKHWMRVSSS